jgi:hypothetical protein
VRSDAARAVDAMVSLAMALERSADRPELLRLVGWV